MLAWQAVGAFVTGDLERGLRLADDAISAAEPLNDHLRVDNASAARALILARSGHAEAAAAIIEPLLHTVADSAADIFITNLPYAAGVVADFRGDYAAAAEWFRRGAAATDGGVDSWIAATSLAELGRVLVRIGDTEEATAILERAVSSATRLGMPRVLATALAARAELAALDPDGVGKAVELDHRALAIRAEHRLLADLPETIEALARHGAALCPGGDDLRLGAAAEAARNALGLPRTPNEEARWSSFVADLRAHLGDATYDTAWAEGEQLTLDRTVEYARRTRGSRARPSVGWSSLTPTELQVAALVADGLSNPEIAARLLMGRGTVKTRLARIFPKVGVTNRAELAAMAIAGARSAGPERVTLGVEPRLRQAETNALT